MVSSQKLSLNSSPTRAITIILTCIQPIFMQDTFSCTLVEANTLQINCFHWGDIGKIVCLESSPGKTEPRFEPPQSISIDELPKYEKQVREECLGLRGRLAELFGQQDIVNNNMAEALYEKRWQRQQEFKVWLFNRLKIFGYRDLYLGTISDVSNKIDEQFEFPVKGTPAQFLVMLRQFAQSLRAQSEYQQLVSHVLLPGSRKDAGNIPPDANPVEIKFALGKSLLFIQAHSLPVGGTLLRAHLNGDINLWELWDEIRDELEKLGWFSLPETPELPEPMEIKPDTQPQELVPPTEVWMSIPDVGANRDILRHWHQGLTCEQIAVRVSLTEKTVLNRIHKLRKQYGNEVVPYRKLNPTKKKKTLSP